ncbi:class VII unconventional myosin [Achlya hypogyna]|uniref:Class VII unconventional myosin n=1 Tax=Achlya hypogyna TaxID=1202772 RepID=A0A1V9Y504_ACHHY|nr:class VII unconventional myosin [Achlya hypogyna]
MSRFTKKGRPPAGFEYLAPVMDALESELRERMNDPQDGLRRRYVYDMYYKYGKISKEVYEYCLRMKLADANLIAKWKKPGYERLCSTFAINPKNYNYGTVSICRVPRQQLADGQLVQERHSGCRGCASGPGGYHNIFGNKYGQHLAAIQIMRERHGAGGGNRIWAPKDDDDRSDVDEEETKEGDEGSDADEEETKEADDSDDNEAPAAASANDDEAPADEDSASSDDATADGPQPKKRKTMRVWIKRPSDGEYVAATVVGDSVIIADDPPLVLPATTPTWPQGEAPDDVDDLASVEPANEPSLLDVLRRRFEAGDVYTFAGHSVLVALHPGARTGSTAGLDALCDGVLRQLHAPLGRKHQTILVAGDSGAGKSAIARHVLCHIGSAVASPRLMALPLAASLVVLEAFGNARTLVNDDSSRFGKSTKVLFDDEGSLVGCATDCYLLEAARVTSSLAGEGTFHIFYQLLQGLSEVEKAVLYLEHDEYAILGCPQGDLRGELADTTAALAACGIPSPDGIYRLLAAILLLGNVLFDGTETATVHPSSAANVAAAEALMQLPPASLATELCRRTLAAAGEPTAVPLSSEAAARARDSLLQALYKLLFQGLARRLNQNLGPPSATSSTKSIEVCDLFGFEPRTAANGLGQLCRHYASEKLHQFFIQFTFKLEQRVYAAEKIAAPPIEFHDNQAVLDLLDKQPQCLLSILEHTSAQRHGTDDAFLQKLDNVFHDHPKFDRAAGAFVVRHTAGDVTYDARAFVGDNKSDVPRALVAMLQACVATALGSPLEPTPAPATVAGKFSADIERLCISLCRTEPHFIKCLQPNASGSPGQFDGAVVANQLRRLGVLDVVQLRQTGYCYRTTFAEFLGQFASLEAYTKATTAPPADPKRRCEALLDRLWAQTDLAELERAATVQVGDRFVFLRKHGIEALEALRVSLQSLLDHDATVIQKLWRGHFVRRQFRRLRAAVTTIARTWRCSSRARRPPVQTRYDAWKRKRVSTKWREHQVSSSDNLALPEAPVDAAPVAPLPLMMTPPSAPNNPPPAPNVEPPPATVTTPSENRKEPTATAPEAPRHRPSALPPLLLLVLALRLQALYRGYKVRQEMAMVMHIVALKRRVRVTLAAAVKLQAWARQLRAQRRFHATRQAAAVLQRWCRLLARRKAGATTLAMRLKIQAAARGFLVRNQLHRQAVDAIAAEAAAKVRSATACEAQAISDAMATRWTKQGMRSVILSYAATADLSHVYKPSWAARWTEVERLAGKPLTGIAVGEAHTMFLTSNGQLFGVGWNDKGQMGTAATTTRPVALPLSLFEGSPVTSIGAGYDHSVALCGNGSVYTWGGSKAGTGRKPRKVAVSPRRVVAIAVGGAQSLALLETGALYHWGPDGRLPQRLQPRTPVKFTTVAAGISFAMATTASGSVFAWGRGAHGELGLGDVDTAPTLTPVAVTVAGKAVAVSAVSCGARHVIALTRCAHVVAWGHNAKGQLGLGDTKDRTTPTRVRALDDVRVASVAASGAGSAAVAAAKPPPTVVVFVWGDVGHAATLSGGGGVMLAPGESRLAPTKFLHSTDDALELRSASSKSVALFWVALQPQKTYTALFRALPPSRPERLQEKTPPAPEPVVAEHIVASLRMPEPAAQRASFVRFLQNPAAATLRSGSDGRRSLLPRPSVAMPRGSMRQSVVALPQRLPSKTFFSAINR